MITDELISYIKKQIEKGNTEEEIRGHLLEAGWISSDIDEAFGKIQTEEVNKDKIKIDPYHELTEEQEEVLKNKINNTVDNSPKVWTPVKIKEVDKEFKLPSVEHSPVLMTASSFVEKKPDIDSVVLNVDNSLSKKVESPIRSVVFENFNKINTSSDNSNLEGESISKHKGAFWMTLFIIILIISGVLAFLLMKGYINLRNINIPFIKTDPKVLLLNNSNKLASLSSYKTETNIQISSPSFANISNSLVTGDKISVIDTDFINMKSIGLINNVDGVMNSESMSTFTSSVLENPIEINIKNINNQTVISVPDMSEVIKNNFLPVKVLLVEEDSLDNIIALLPSNINSILNKINIYEILNSGLSSSVTDSSLSFYNDFINNVSIIEKGKEVIKGVETYHYEVNTDKEVTRSLISKISERFFNRDINNNLEESILNSSKIKSFEVWVGKDDNNIYQYRLVITIPLSKVLNLEEGSLANSEVEVDLVSTYYDFDIPNDILETKDFIDTETFIKEANDKRLQNNVLKLKEFSNRIKSSEGSYGKVVNKGNCSNPLSSSLFSPLGHTKGAMLPVADMASSMTEILEVTKGLGSCYSNPTSWAVSFPLSSEEGWSYCYDSVGYSTKINTELKGFVCPQPLPEVKEEVKKEL